MPIIEYWNGIQTVVNTPTVWTTMNTATASTGSTWINCGAGGGGLFGDGGGTCYATQMANPFIQTADTFVGIIEMDEEQYVQHAEYYELARQRGVVFRIRTAEQTR